MNNEPYEGTRFPRLIAALPWLIGASGMLIYVLTLNHWVSLTSLPLITRVSGWDWRPQLTEPLTTVIVSPFRLLPEPWIPITLNLFSAFCAALVLALLARSVMLLLPQKSDSDQPGAGASLPMAAWMPSVMAG